DEQLVVLGERVRHPELVFIVREAFARLVEYVVGVEVRPQALATVDAERDDAPVRTGQLREGRLVGPGDERGDVRRDSRGGLEAPGRRVALTVVDRFRRGRVRDH